MLTLRAWLLGAVALKVLSDVVDAIGRSVDVAIRVADRKPLLDSVDNIKHNRILLCGEERQWVSGTETEIDEAATRMARRTKQCVTVAVAIAHYHRRGCKDLPAGGLDVVGN
jgi:hypothetical protein